MTLTDQSVGQFIKRFHLLVLSMKRIGKVFMSLPQRLNVVNGALFHTAVQHAV